MSDVELHLLHEKFENFQLSSRACSEDEGRVGEGVKVGTEVHEVLQDVEATLYAGHE